MASMAWRWLSLIYRTTPHIRVSVRGGADSPRPKLRRTCPLPPTGGRTQEQLLTMEAETRRAEERVQPGKRQHYHAFTQVPWQPTRQSLRSCIGDPRRMRVQLNNRRTPKEDAMPARPICWMDEIIQRLASIKSAVDFSALGDEIR